MVMTLAFTWHEIKACIAGQMSGNQTKKHEVTTINDKYGNDTRCMKSIY